MITLPTAAHTLEPYHLTGTPLAPRAPKVPLTRAALTEAPLVCDPLRSRNPWDSRPALDWDATIALRQGLWDQGLDLAEALHIAQRFGALDWTTAAELVTQTLTAAKAHPLQPRVVCGICTDHRALAEHATLDAIASAYEDQAEAVEFAGGHLLIMPSPAFAALEADEAGYRKVYRWLIDGAKDPVILHWQGAQFDPALAGYWGTTNLAHAAEVLLGLIAENPAKVEGVKISAMDPLQEAAFRAFLPKGVRLYTGDEANFIPLIEGDGKTHSHALLGLLAAIAPAAVQALEALAQGDPATYHRLLAPTLPLSHELFRAPLAHGAAGVSFLSWLNGSQNHFTLPGGLQAARDITHYAQIFRLADQAGLLAQPGLATRRMGQLLALHGIEQR